MDLAAQATPSGSTLFLIGIALTWYIASRAAAAAMAGGSPDAPIRRAVGHAVPGIVMACVAAWCGAGQISIGLIFASSVAAMSLVAGITLLAAHDDTSMDVRAGSTAVLAVLAPVLAMLAGFAAIFTGLHGVVMLAMGLAAVVLWSGREKPAASVGNIPNARKTRAADAVQLFLSVALAVVGAIGAVSAGGSLAMNYGGISLTAVGALLLTPIVSLPLIGASLDACGRHRSGIAIHTVVAFVLINLCFALPLTIAVDWARQNMPPASGNTPVASVAPAPATNPATGPATRSVKATSQPATAITAQPATRATNSPVDPEDEPAAIITSTTTPFEFQPLAYPLLTWRLDTVLLIVLSLLLAPMLLGRWRLGRVEGVILLLGYLVYMSMSAIMSRPH